MQTVTICVGAMTMSEFESKPETLRINYIQLRGESLQLQQQTIIIIMSKIIIKFSLGNWRTATS